MNANVAEYVGVTDGRELPAIPGILSPLGNRVLVILHEAINGQRRPKNFDDLAEWQLLYLLDPILGWMSDADRPRTECKQLALQIANLASEEEAAIANSAPLHYPDGNPPAIGIALLNFLSRSGRRTRVDQRRMVTFERPPGDQQNLVAISSALGQMLLTVPWSKGSSSLDPSLRPMTRVASALHGLRAAEVFDATEKGLAEGFQNHLDLGPIMAMSERYCADLRREHNYLPADLTHRLALLTENASDRLQYLERLLRRSRLTSTTKITYPSRRERLLDESFLTGAETAEPLELLPFQKDGIRDLLDGSRTNDSCWGLFWMASGKSMVVWGLSQHLSQVEGRHVVQMAGTQLTDREEIYRTFLQQGMQEGKDFIVPNSGQQFADNFGRPGLIQLVTSPMMHEGAQRLQGRPRPAERPYVVIDELHLAPSPVRGLSLDDLGGIVIGITGQEALPSGEEMDDRYGPRVAAYAETDALRDGRTMEVKILIPASATQDFDRYTGKRMNRNLDVLLDEAVVLIHRDDALRGPNEANQKAVLVGSIAAARHAYKKLLPEFRDRLYVVTSDPEHRESNEEHNIRLRDRCGITISVDMEISGVNRPALTAIFNCRTLGERPFTQMAMRAGRTINPTFTKRFGLVKGTPFVYDITASSRPAEVTRLAAKESAKTTVTHGRVSGRLLPSPSRFKGVSDLDRGLWSVTLADVRAWHWQSFESVVRAADALGPSLTPKSVALLADGVRLPGLNKIASYFGSVPLFVWLVSSTTRESAAQLRDRLMGRRVESAEDVAQIEGVFGSVRSFDQLFNGARRSPGDVCSRYFRHLAYRALKERPQDVDLKMRMVETLQQWSPTVRAAGDGAAEEVAKLLAAASKQDPGLGKPENAEALCDYIIETMPNEPAVLESLQNTLAPSDQPVMLLSLCKLLGVHPIALSECFADRGGYAGMIYVLQALTKPEWETHLRTRLERIDQRIERVVYARTLPDELAMTPGMTKPQFVPFLPVDEQITHGNSSLPAPKSSAVLAIESDSRSSRTLGSLGMF